MVVVRILQTHILNQSSLPPPPLTHENYFLKYSTKHNFFLVFIIKAFFPLMFDLSIKGKNVLLVSLNLWQPTK